MTAHDLVGRTPDDRTVSAAEGRQAVGGAGNATGRAEGGSHPHHRLGTNDEVEYQ